MRVCRLLPFCLLAWLSAAERRGPLLASPQPDSSGTRIKVDGVTSKSVASSAALDEATEELAVAVEAFREANVYRKSMGLKQLGWNQEMYRLNLKHSLSQAREGRMSHDGLIERVKALSFKNSGYAENVCFHGDLNSTGAVAVKMWIDSPTHHENLVGDYDGMVVAAARSKSNGNYYFTQMFIRVPSRNFPYEKPPTGEDSSCSVPFLSSLIAIVVLLQVAV